MSPPQGLGRGRGDFQLNCANPCSTALGVGVGAPQGIAMGGGSGGCWMLGDTLEETESCNKGEAGSLLTQAPYSE